MVYPSKAISKPELYDMYWKQKLSMNKIAKQLHVSVSAVLEWMKKYHIPRRSLSEALKGNIPWHANRRVTVQCLLCGTSFSITKSRYERGDCKYCSQKCYAIAKRGTSLTSTHKQKISEALIASEKFRKAIKSKNRSKKISVALTGRRTGRVPSSAFKKGHIPWNKGKQHSEKTKAKIREARKKQKIPTSNTKPELQFERICAKHKIPLKYVGNGSLWVGGLNPDFVVGDKTAIDIFGRVFHDPDNTFKKKIPFHRTEWGRKEIFKKHGWKLVVFWDDELSNEDRIVKILEEINLDFL